MRSGILRILRLYEAHLVSLAFASSPIISLGSSKELFTSGYKLYLSSIFLAPCGYLAGYGLATLAKLPKRQRRTIALETGIQNSTLTISIIVLSFPEGDAAATQLQRDVLAFALMYSLFLVLSGVIVTYIFRRMSVDDAQAEEVSEVNLCEVSFLFLTKFFTRFAQTCREKSRSTARMSSLTAKHITMSTTTPWTNCDFISHRISQSPE